MNKIDFLSLIIDVTNAATPQLIEIDSSITNSDVTEQYAFEWAKCIKAAMEAEGVIQFSARYNELIRNYTEVQVKRLAKAKNIKKVAKLVVFEVMTRVVVDKNDFTPEAEDEEAINKAISKLSADEVRNIICWDNCTDVMVDTDCPYGTFDGEQ